MKSAPVFVNTNHLHHPWLYFANKAEWQKLPTEVQDKILASFPALEAQSKQYFADLSRKMEETRAKGVTIVEPSEAELAQWRTAIEPILGKLVADMTPGAQKLFAAIMEGKQAFARRKAQ